MNCKKCGMEFAGKKCPECNLHPGGMRIGRVKYLVLAAGMLAVVLAVLVVTGVFVTPEGTVGKYLNAALAGDASKAIQYWEPAMVEELAKTYGMSRAELAEAMFDSSLNLTDSMTYTIESASRSGKTATVRVKFVVTYPDSPGEQEEFTDVFYLVKQGRKWYITN